MMKMTMVNHLYKKNQKNSDKEEEVKLYPTHSKEINIPF